MCTAQQKTDDYQCAKTSSMTHGTHTEIGPRNKITCLDEVQQEDEEDEREDFSSNKNSQPLGKPCRADVAAFWITKDAFLKQH